MLAGTGGGVTSPAQAARGMAIAVVQDLRT